jgi:uncharacterized protein with PIN domain
MEPHAPLYRTATFRFYEELNDFLAPERRKRDFEYAFRGSPSAKDVIESIGVPHVEIDLVLVDGRSVGFDHGLTGGEHVSVYPMFELFDIHPIVRLRAEPLRTPRFAADDHLRRLARYLRMVGFDTLWDPRLSEADLIDGSRSERRTILSRSRRLLRHGKITHGRWIRNEEPLEQLKEVISAFDLKRLIKPFTRCMECNGMLDCVSREAITELLPEDLDEAIEQFSLCRSCGKAYWEGTHVKRMREIVGRLKHVNNER